MAQVRSHTQPYAAMVEALNTGIVALGLTLPAAAVDKLLAYLALLVKWNRTYNLTAIRDPTDMVTHHLLDSLAVLPLLQKSALAGRQFSSPPLALADVGSGAGLPGLVLAMACPDWSVTSIEVVKKKVAFQRQVKIELGLDNVVIHGGRVEGVQEHFAGVMSRAFASLADFVRLAGHLSPCLLALKGGYPTDEIAALPPGWRVTASDVVRVPGLDAQRHLLQLEKN